MTWCPAMRLGNACPHRVYANAVVIDGQRVQSAMAYCMRQPAKCAEPDSPFGPLPPPEPRK